MIRLTILVALVMLMMLSCVASGEGLAIESLGVDGQLYDTEVSRYSARAYGTVTLGGVLYVSGSMQRQMASGLATTGFAGETGFRLGSGFSVYAGGVEDFNANYRYIGTRLELIGANSCGLFTGKGCRHNYKGGHTSRWYR